MTDSILNHPDILRALFHPRPDYGYLGVGAQAVSIEAAPDTLVCGRLYAAEPESPLILYYHGNGEIAADYDDLSDLYKRINVSLLVMDYRGYGASSGTPDADNLAHDGVTTFNALPQVFARHQINPARVYVMGRSLGSVTAIEIARQAGNQVAGLMIESGFSDTFGLLERLGVQVQGADERRDGFGNAFKMEHVSAPTLILHGTHDVLIPPSDGQELHQHCAAEQKHMVLIKGAGHNDIMLVGVQPYFEAIRQFIFPAA